MNFKKLYELVDAFPISTVLCVGDMMLDEYVSGQINRVSPEAPVPIIQRKNVYTTLGGVGNVAANVVALGCETSVFYAAAPDKDGETVKQMLEDKHIHTYPFSAATMTTKKQRIIARKQQICRIDSEEPLNLTKQQEDKIIHQVSSLFPHVNTVLIADYNKGFITPRVAQGIIQAAREQNKCVLVSPKGTDYEKYKGATLIKPNLAEFKAIMKQITPGLTEIEALDPADDQDLQKIEQLAPIMREKLGTSNLVVTLGQHGILGSDEDGVIYRPTEEKSVSDISGAGDTTLAVLGASFGSCITLENAMDLANIGAGVVIEKEGTATLSSRELKSSIRNLFNNEPTTFWFNASGPKGK